MLFTQLSITNVYLKGSYGLYERHNEIDFDYDFAVENTVRYLNNKQNYYDFPSFPGGNDILMTERGITHMHDVKVVINDLRRVALFLVIFVSLYTFYLREKEQLKKVLKHLYITPIVLFAFIGGFTIVNFDWLFTKFHELLFDNDLWLLTWQDPLLKMVPEPFFMATGVIIVSLTLVSAIVISLISRR
jgi:integral membrane protein (TIGR01906 family)